MDLNANIRGVLIDPHPGSSLDPMPGSAHDPMPGRSNSAEPTESHPNGLVAQALLSHRAAIVRASDRAERTQMRGTRQPTLWQWASSVRVGAVTREVTQALRFAHGAWWLVPDLASDGRITGNALELLRLLPPSPDRLNSQLMRVIDCADERPDRLAEILVQADGLWPFWTAVTHVVPGQAARTAELMAVAQAVASHIGHQFKQALAVPRPTDLSPLVQPCLTTPGHGAMPSGHAIAAFTASRLLGALLSSSVFFTTNPVARVDTVGIALDRTARRIAANRVVAGLHYPLDNSAGWCVAETTFEVLSMMAGRQGTVPTTRRFDADTTTVEALPDDDVPLTDAAVGSTGIAQTGTATVSPMLTLLWDAAEAELSRLQLN
ncbi:phosphatase PAP2 family protein [Ideonella sp. A 288]|uniref:phosphatase PAP2 family protein n=1 Tax=Ideonella sp. A 288 TaxID=1962181 RepID=UPI001184FB64|nr:phosphatase PAP2 family protein [Ideonella sp. A 288]